jgi:hypothetical protein
MTYPSAIEDPRNASGQVSVSDDQTPATSRTVQKAFQYPFLEYFRTSAGVINMKVNGSVTPVNFALQARDGKLVVIDRLRLTVVSQVMGIGAGEGNQWGANGLLANGFRVYIQHAGVEYELAGTSSPITTAIHSAIDMIEHDWQYCPPVGIPRVNMHSAGVDVNWFDYIFAAPVQLWPNTNDQIVFSVRDALTSAQFTSQFLVGTGYQEDV